jgi:hypothetical protein
VHIRDSWLQYPEMRNVRYCMHDESRGGNCDELLCRAPRPPSLALDSPNVDQLIGFACRGRVYAWAKAV